MLGPTNEPRSTVVGMADGSDSLAAHQLLVV